MQLPQVQRPDAKPKTPRIEIPRQHVPALNKIPAVEKSTAPAVSSFIDRGESPSSDQQWSYRYQLDQGPPPSGGFPLEDEKVPLKQKKSNSFPNLTLNFDFGDKQPLERVESSLSNDGRLMRELGSILQ